MQHTKYQNCSGLSLLELMIAMVLGLTVMSGVISVLMVSKSNFTTEIAIAGLQENARNAIKFMTEEIRMAGYSTCQNSFAKKANIIKGSLNKWYLNGVGIQGYEQFDRDSGRLTFPAEFNKKAIPHSDAIIIRRGEYSDLLISSDHANDSSTLLLNKSHDIQKGEIVILASVDCQQLGLFQVSNPSNKAKNATTLAYSPGSIAPGNCRQKLAGNLNCRTGSSQNHTYPGGSQVMRLKSTAFYIGESAFNDSPALYQEILTISKQAITTTSQELVQGVENMQISYGLDNVGDDGAVDQYMNADAARINWNKVVCVRLSLRLRSLYPVYNTPQTYSAFMNIKGTEGSDRYLRQQVTTTIQLRNH